MFVAIELPENIREKLMAHSRWLRELVPTARANWGRPDNIHLTLKFVGEIDKDRTAQLVEASSRATEKFTPFTAGVAGTGVFPPRGVPRVLWIGVTDPFDGLFKLHAQLEQECLQAGFEKDNRPFRPHLTLARLRKHEGANALALAHQELSFKPEEFLVREVLVMRSELLSAGSKYTTISRHCLTR